MASDDLDILTIAEAEQAIGLPINAPQQQANLELWVTSISRRLDDLCGPVVQRAVTDEWHDGYVPALFLLEQPVVSITTLTEYASTSPQALTADTIPAEVDEALTLAQYGYRLDNGVLYRTASGSASTFGQRVRVSYIAGRYEDTASVDPKFKAAAGMILRRLWAREAGAWARGGEMFQAEGVGFFKVVQTVVEEFLADELLAPAVA